VLLAIGILFWSMAYGGLALMGVGCWVMEVCEDMTPGWWRGFAVAMLGYFFAGSSAMVGMLWIHLKEKADECATQPQS